MTKTKQTAANNAFLRAAKAHWNKPIYAQTLAIVNAAADAAAGELEATRWLRQFSKTGQAEIAAEEAQAQATAAEPHKHLLPGIDARPVLANIASRLGFETFDITHTASDFKPVSVWQLRTALEAAYAAGAGMGAAAPSVSLAAQRVLDAVASWVTDDQGSASLQAIIDAELALRAHAKTAAALTMEDAVQSVMDMLDAHHFASIDVSDDQAAEFFKQLAQHCAERAIHHKYPGRFGRRAAALKGIGAR